MAYATRPLRLGWDVDFFAVIHARWWVIGLGPSNARYLCLWGVLAMGKSMEGVGGFGIGSHVLGGKVGGGWGRGRGRCLQRTGICDCRVYS